MHWFRRTVLAPEFIEDACGGSSPHPHTTCRSCVSIGKIAAMISAMNSTCRAEVEPATDDAEAEASRVFTAEIIAADFRTDALKLALSE